MKCIQCDKDIKRKDRVSPGGRSRCPKCRHPFVTEPVEDRLTDRALQNAVTAASNDGLYYYLRRHLHYEVMRRHLYRVRNSHRWAWVSLAIAIAGLAGALMFDAFPLLLVTVIGGIVFLVRISGRVQTKRSLEDLLDSWIDVNPDEKLMLNSRSDRAASDKDELGEVSFDQVLICDRDEYVDFFLANLFHFHFSCPVLGISGYPKDVAPDMIKRLRNNPALKVFLVHDLTPGGLSLEETVKNNPAWFGGMDVDITDLGLGLDHGEMVSRFFTSKSYVDGPQIEAGGDWAELTVIKPAVLMQLCGAGIRDGKPFPVKEQKSSTSSGSGFVGYGGYG